MSSVAEFFTDSPTTPSDLAPLEDLRERAEDSGATKERPPITSSPRLAQYLVRSSRDWRTRRQVELWSSSPTIAVQSWTDTVREAAPRTTASILIPHVLIPAIPAWRTALEAAIHDSWWIRDLADDWDG